MRLFEWEVRSPTDAKETVENLEFIAGLFEEPRRTHRHLRRASISYRVVIAGEEDKHPQ